MKIRGCVFIETFLTMVIESEKLSFRHPKTLVNSLI